MRAVWFAATMGAAVVVLAAEDSMLFAVVGRAFFVKFDVDYHIFKVNRPLSQIPLRRQPYLLLLTQYLIFLIPTQF